MGLSFSLASMMASTAFFWLRVGSVHEKYKSALVISGLVTFIAAYHYIRIFNSWTEAYEFPKGSNGADPVLTGKPFSDAYRYMDWLLTVVSWCTYPVVYLFPFLNLSGAQAVVGIQLGYCVSDVISKCGVGFLIYNITIQKSEALKKGALLA